LGQYVTFVMAAYRSSRHEATNYIPNFLLLRREVRTPVNVVYGMPVKLVPVNYDDYAEEINDEAYQTPRCRRGPAQPTVVLTVPCSTDAAACS